MCSRTTSTPMPPDPHTHPLSLKERDTDRDKDIQRKLCISSLHLSLANIKKEWRQSFKKKTGALDKNVDFSIYYFSLNTLLLGYAHWFQ